MSKSGGAPFVGADAANGGAGSPYSPIYIEEELIQVEAEASSEDGSTHILHTLNDDQYSALQNYLTGRLNAGKIVRDRRSRRYGRIDKQISTWQRLNKDDTKRELDEEMSGKSRVIPFNMPILASHLNDMVSYFSEALAPISNPFFSAQGDATPHELTTKMNRDALRNDYYSQLALTLRGLLKYNIGGLTVVWDEEDKMSPNPSLRVAGNRWVTCDMYNTFWDPAIRDLSTLPTSAEWAATTQLTNRMMILRKSLSGRWVRTGELLEENCEGESQSHYYKEPAVDAGIGLDGEDGKTSATGAVNWAAFSLGFGNDLGPAVGGYEQTEMYCWIVPQQFGLLSSIERTQLLDSGREPKTFLELWKFTIIGENRIVDAAPLIPREEYLNGEAVEIPIYLIYMTRDQINEAQRSFMELMRGFQRFANNMYNIYIQGMRKNVWGVKGYDPQMFDVSSLKEGEVVGLLASKQPGRDVRTGLTDATSNAGVDGALQAVDNTLALKDRFFPTQAMPGQIASIDRAVKSQVTTVVQGSQRSMRMILRLIDSGLMLPTRLAAFRNLKRHDRQGIENITDAVVAKLVGSGIESMEAERVSEALWQLLYAIIQNQESMQTFNVPALLTYIGRVANLSVDLGQFARQQQQQPGQQPQQQPQG